MRAGGSDGRFWSPLIEGDALILAIEIPPTVDPASIHLSLPRLSHLDELPYSLPGHPLPSDCHEDVMCHPAWNQPSRATAILLYTRPDGGSAVCSGTLLRDADPATDIPYFLTAHHCVPDRARAASLETYWLHRSHACNRAPARAQTVTGGADLLYTDRATDTSFLRLHRSPPPGAVYAAWSTNPPALGQPVAGIHHPQGQPQRIALGTLTERLHCIAIEDCGADPESGEEHYLRVTWTTGITSGGGSGSGLFLPTGELVGNLYGGFSRCDNPQGPDDYGRFDLAYRAGLHRWLGSPQE
ncbi:trypsin-like serine peptidase [Thiocystis violascens]|uniref:V8-like Glu-specific endopeptidase n=1 Tax=Thiocystis violascens (strain ATCC 17096 / DSM 198 / 6111) TaxID=765911 RepID=I3YA40_THIV6|nr:trypsin-like peptidase domain-containing protein [Thiocystis violascens]AFL73858.1 hypothetical protein Thivi_1890 [Thiocystis violascens DSM 198]